MVNDIEHKGTKFLNISGILNILSGILYSLLLVRLFISSPIALKTLRISTYNKLKMADINLSDFGIKNLVFIASIIFITFILISFIFAILAISKSKKVGKRVFFIISGLFFSLLTIFLLIFSFNWLNVIPLLAWIFLFIGGLLANKSNTKIQYQAIDNYNNSNNAEYSHHPNYTNSIHNQTNLNLEHNNQHFSDVPSQENLGLVRNYNTNNDSNTNTEPMQPLVGLSGSRYNINNSKYDAFSELSPIPGHISDQDNFEREMARYLQSNDIESKSSYEENKDINREESNK